MGVLTSGQRAPGPLCLGVVVQAGFATAGSSEAEGSECPTQPVPGVLGSMVKVCGDRAADRHDATKLPSAQGVHLYI